MGACIDYYSFRGTEQQLKDFHKQKCTELCEEHGNDTYAGHLGILPEGLNMCSGRFKGFNAAMEYVEENHSKWSQAMAVVYLQRGRKFFLVAGWCPE